PICPAREAAQALRDAQFARRAHQCPRLHQSLGRRSGLAAAFGYNAICRANASVDASVSQAVWTGRCTVEVPGDLAVGNALRGVPVGGGTPRRAFPTDRNRGFQRSNRAADMLDERRKHSCATWRLLLVVAGAALLVGCGKRKQEEYSIPRLID